MWRVNTVLAAQRGAPASVLASVESGLCFTDCILCLPKHACQEEAVCLPSKH